MNHLLQDKVHKKRLHIDGRIYRVQVNRQVTQPVQAPRLAIVSYQPNNIAQSVLRVCIQTIQRYTPEPHELWVVDNNSPWKNVTWLLQWPDLNVVLNRTEPLAADRRGLRARLQGKAKQYFFGSYANAIGLELAVRLIDPQSHYLMTLHMDTMPCREGWLSYLLSKFDDGIGAVGVRMGKKRVPEGVLHILGCLVDFQLFRKFNMDFMPHPPRYDVGDRITVALREAGYDVFACRNTFTEPHLIEIIPSSSPLRHLRMDRYFDDDDNVFFLNLGRGISKSTGRYPHPNKTMPEEWVDFAEKHLLS